MSSRTFRTKRGVFATALTFVLAFQQVALGQDCDAGCGANCPHHHCPPPFRHCTESPPCIKFKCGCPKPVCPPSCDTPNWGYFEPCWRPWPWQRTFAHCPCATPAAFASTCAPEYCTVPGAHGPGAPAPDGEPLPPPRKVDPNLRKPS
jgi:hypothetical protein